MKLKKNKGISLIVLIITIVVIIILATAIIVNLAKSNIIGSANKATEDSIKSQLKRAIILAIMDIEIENADNSNGITLELISENLPNKVGGIIIEDVDNEILGQCQGYYFTIYDNHEVIIGDKINGINITYTLSKNEYTNEDINMFVEATSTDGEIVSIECNSDLKKNDDGSYLVTKNGRYKFTAKDSTEATKTVSIKINNIDKINPKEINVAIDGFTVNVNAIDGDKTDEYSSSGIDKYIYYVNDESYESKSNSYTIDDSKYLENMENLEIIVYVEVYDKAGNFIKSEEKPIEIDVDEVIKNNDSLIGKVSQINSSGFYQITVNSVTYNINALVYDGDLAVDGSWNSVFNKYADDADISYNFGDSNDVATATEDAKNMVLLKINGNLTITANHTVSAYKNENYGGPKGLMIYCTGTLTNNGKISMTARGARAKGENVYLWKNKDNKYEFVPKDGADGGKSVKRQADGSSKGDNGTDGTERRTGGGGSGAAARWSSATAISGTGTQGTSYSGGSGGGGCSTRVGTTTAGNATENGGAGGNAATKTNVSTEYTAGGGAGNPGGNGSRNGSSLAARNGSNGTGGLLMIYAKKIKNTGTILSNGSKGGNSAQGAQGGSSGAGSINIFYGIKFENIGEINAISESNSNGGKGGNGSVTIGNIATGNFRKIEQ